MTSKFSSIIRAHIAHHGFPKETEEEKLGKNEPAQKWGDAG